MLGIPRATPWEELPKRVAALRVEPSDEALKANALNFFRKIEADSVDARERGNILRHLSSLSRIAHRYGNHEQSHIFLVPVRGDEVDGDRPVALGSIMNEKNRALAKRVPQRNREALIEIMREALPRLKFDRPSEEAMDAVSTEKLALWVLLLRFSEFGDWQQAGFADAVFNLMLSGRSKDFFHPANETNYYQHVLFTNWRFTADEIADITVTLEAVAKFRARNIDYTVKGAILGYIDDSYVRFPWLSYLAVDFQGLFFPLRRWFGRGRLMEGTTNTLFAD